MAQLRTAVVSVRSTKGERAEIRKAAKQARQTVSTYVLVAALERARSAERNGAVATSPAQPKSSREHSAEMSACNEARVEQPTARAPYHSEE